MTERLKDLREAAEVVRPCSYCGPGKGIIRQSGGRQCPTCHGTGEVTYRDKTRLALLGIIDLQGDALDEAKNSLSMVAAPSTRTIEDRASIAWDALVAAKRALDRAKAIAEGIHA